MKTRILLIAVILVLQSIFACKKDVSNPIELVGKWGTSNEWEDGYIYHEELNFKVDGSIEIIGSVIDLQTNTTKGYLNKEIGSYSLQGDNLVYTNMKSYRSDLPGYQKIEDLQHQHTQRKSSRKLQFNSTMNEITLYYGRCNDNAVCVGPKTYLKK